MEKQNKNDNVINNSKIYPKDDRIKLNKKRKKKLKNKIFTINKNPSITHFNIGSTFIFSEEDFINYFNNITNKNLVKLDNDEIEFLSNKINEIKNITVANNLNDLIEINKCIYDKFKNFKNMNNKEDEISLFIKNKIMNIKNRAGISCRKLSQLYMQEKGQFVGKSTIHKILKNNLGLHYIKTCKKSNFLRTNLGIFSCLAFIKIITRAIKLGYEFIFLDESTIRLNNNNYKCWRKSNEQIYFGKINKEKINLILSVTKDEIFYYELINENINSEIFLNYIKKINEKLMANKSKKYIIIMDNCSSHKTEKVIMYYNEQKMNILFNVQYCSFFNTVELSFRALKKKLSNNLYENKEEIINDIEQYFQKEETKITLLKNYKETLEEYLFYSEENKGLNLNNFEIEK